MPGRIICAILVAAATASGAAYGAERYDFGRPATSAEIVGWNIKVSPNGAELPPDTATCGKTKGSSPRNARVATARGEGKPMGRLVGRIGTLRDKKPEKTVGSFWPYPMTLFDFVRRAMPLNAPHSLTPDEVYAVSAYGLFLNGIVPQDVVLDANNLAKIKMPNRDGFVSAYPSVRASRRP
jgi:S-disulfanyl-L-cysteine oxidoreductase SoxD